MIEEQELYLFFLFPCLEEKYKLPAKHVGLDKQGDRVWIPQQLLSRATQTPPALLRVAWDPPGKLHQWEKFNNLNENDS